MTMLDLVVYHKEKQSLQSVREVRLAKPYKTIPFDIRKSSVVLFINELLYKAIREEEPNPELFGFLWQTCLRLDETEESVADFHLCFAVHLMRFLGIFPQNNYSERLPVFNMRDGLFQSSFPGHTDYLEGENSRMLHHLLEETTSNGEMAKWRNGEIAKSRIPNLVSRIPNPGTKFSKSSSAITSSTFPGSGACSRITSSMKFWPKSVSLPKIWQHDDRINRTGNHPQKFTE